MPLVDVKIKYSTIALVVLHTGFILMMVAARDLRRWYNIALLLLGLILVVYGGKHYINKEKYVGDRVEY